MGRRSLRKLDPALDLTGHLGTFDTLPDPWDASKLFGVDRPLEVEVGSGKGLFIATAAAGQPMHNFLGLEVAGKYARHSAARLARAELDNAHMVHGDALRVFCERLPADSLAAVHVYFPDPWWKKRHRKRRVMHEPLLRDIQRTLLPGGTLHFWTDVKEYFDASLELIAQVTDLRGPYDVSERPSAGELDYRTHFERRTRLNDEPVYRVEFRKDDVSASSTA